MPANIEDEAVDYRPLALRGAEAGVVSGAVIAVIAMAACAFTSGTDVWSFPKVISTIALGDHAAQPLTGWETAPVLVGLALHLVVSSVLGMAFGVIVGFTSCKDAAPTLLAGFVYGIVVYFFTYVLIANALFPKFRELPDLVFLAVHPVFGAVAALLLMHWADRWDHGPAEAGHDVTWVSPDATGFHVVVAAVVVFAAALGLAALGLEPRAILTILVAVAVAATIAHLMLHVHLPRPGRRRAAAP
jgi:hypothetical protein